MIPKLLIAESRGFSKAAIDVLKEHFDVKCDDLDRAGLVKRVGEFDVLWVRVRTMIDNEIMDAAPKLKWIATNTTGLNHIDLAAAQKRGIQVVSLQGESDFLRKIRATAELTIGLTLALLRRIPAACQHVMDGGWDRSLFQGQEIFEKTVGIIGYGRLGKIVARYFEALGAHVIIHDRRIEAGVDVDGFQSKSLNELLSQSDIVSLHASYEPPNHHMIGNAQFAKMKPTAILVNTARGELVDDESLANALESDALAGAAIDVIESEHCERPSKQRLIELARTTHRLVITPHIGGNTLESMAKTEIFLAEKLCVEKGVWNFG